MELSIFISIISINNFFGTCDDDTILLFQSVVNRNNF